MQNHPYVFASMFGGFSLGFIAMVSLAIIAQSASYGHQWAIDMGQSVPVMLAHVGALFVANLVMAAIWALGKAVIEEAKARPLAFAVLASCLVLLACLAVASP